MAPPALHLLDGATPVSFAFEDLIAYHGRESIGGLALGFQALALGLAHLGPGPVARRELVVATAFDGPGFRDAAELVTRAVTGGRYRHEPALAGTGASEAPQGHFVFRLELGRRSVTLSLRAGLVTDEFIALVRRGPAGEAEEAHLAALKEDLAARLLARPPAELFDVAIADDGVDR